MGEQAYNRYVICHIVWDYASNTPEARDKYQGTIIEKSV